MEYSEILLDLYKNPLNFGELKDYDIKASGGNASCGDLIEFTIKIEDGKIKDIKFKGQGCAISNASASLLTEQVKGKTVKEAKEMKTEEANQMLGGIIKTRIKCFSLAKIVLEKAINEWEKKGKQKIEIKIRI